MSRKVRPVSQSEEHFLLSHFDQGIEQKLIELDTKDENCRMICSIKSNYCLPTLCMELLIVSISKIVFTAKS